MAHKMLNYSELLRCLLQGQEFIPLSSKLGFLSILLDLWI